MQTAAGLCFPFNCRQELAGGHQNRAIVCATKACHKTSVQSMTEIKALTAFALLLSKSWLKFAIGLPIPVARRSGAPMLRCNAEKAAKWEQMGDFTRYLADENGPANPILDASVWSVIAACVPVMHRPWIDVVDQCCESMPSTNRQRPDPQDLSALRNVSLHAGH